MDQKLQEAADAIRRAAKMYENFQIAAQALDRVGSLEQAEQEATARTEAAKREAEIAKAELGAITEETEDAIAKRDGVIADTNAECARILASAEAAAQEKMAQAGENAQAIVREAQSNAASIVAAARAEANGIHDSVAAAAAAKDAAEVARDAAQRELDELNGKIQAAKEQIAKLLG